MLITRSDRSAIALWWWTIDRVLLSSFFILVIFGIFLVMASSQHLAESLNISSHHFTLRHILFGLLSLPVIVLFSVLNERQTKAVCIVGLLICLCLLLFILFDSSKIKGAQRWVHFLGFSFQPSEVCKPFYVIVNAWLLSLWIEKKRIPRMAMVNRIIDFDFYIIIVTARCWHDDCCNIDMGAPIVCNRNSIDYNSLFNISIPIIYYFCIP